MLYKIIEIIKIKEESINSRRIKSQTKIMKYNTASTIIAYNRRRRVAFMSFCFYFMIIESWIF